MSLRSAWLCIALCAGVVTSASAQSAPFRGAREGTWMTAGLGGGWTRVSCAICNTDRNAGPSAGLRFGTTLRPGLLVGAELDGWTRSHDDVRTMLAAGSAAAYIYPDPSRGLFLKAGAGLVHFGFDTDDAGMNLFGLLLGAGYEFPVTPELNVTNTIGVIASSFGTLRSEEGVIADDVSISMFHIGIALTHR